MNKIEIIRKFWDPEGTPFEADFAFHLTNPRCLVYSWGSSFIMARPVNIEEPTQWNEQVTWPLEKCQAWFVWAAVGKASELVKLMTDLAPKLPFIIRKKNNKFQVVRTDRLERLMKHG